MWERRGRGRMWERRGRGRGKERRRRRRGSRRRRIVWSEFDFLFDLNGECMHDRFTHYSSQRSAILPRVAIEFNKIPFIDRCRLRDMATIVLCNQIMPIDTTIRNLLWIFIDFYRFLTLYLHHFNVTLFIHWSLLIAEFVSWHFPFRPPLHAWYFHIWRKWSMANWHRAIIFSTGCRKSYTLHHWKSLFLSDPSNTNVIQSSRVNHSPIWTQHRLSSLGKTRPILTIVNTFSVFIVWMDHTCTGLHHTFVVALIFPSEL